MGAFLLISEGAGYFNKEEALVVMGHQCLTEPVKFALTGWELYLFPKRLTKCTNYRHENGRSVFVTGTPFFFGKTYSSTIEILLQEAYNGNFPGTGLCGLYFLLQNDGKSLKFSTDPGGIYSLFHSKDNMVLSSSFLSLCSGLPSLTPDKDAITENLVTGSIIGSETVFKEIRRFDPLNPASFKGIEYVKSVGRQALKYGFKNRRESIKGQLEVLDEYFSGLRQFVDEAGADSGITGGFDSRLLLSLSRRHFEKDKIQFHSHFRHNPDEDFRIGKSLCDNLALEFITIPYKEFLPDSSDAEAILERCMLYTDGQARTHSFWHEEFNGAENRILTLGLKRLGLSGIGGEQYRNSERLTATHINKINWIRYNLVRRSAGEPFISKAEENRLVERLDDKISGRLGLYGKSRVDLYSIKRYMNEVYIPANRGLRAINDNRLAWSLLPFADYSVSRAAYKSVPFLGRSLDYEAEMIRFIDPQAASVESGYGYPFSRREPVYKTMSFILFENVLPWSLRQIISEKMLSRNTGIWRNLIDASTVLSKAESCLNEFSLPMDLKLLSVRTDIGPLVFALGFLMEKYKSKII